MIVAEAMESATGMRNTTTRTSTDRRGRPVPPVVWPYLLGLTDCQLGLLRSQPRAVLLAFPPPAIHGRNERSPRALHREAEPLR